MTVVRDLDFAVRIRVTVAGPPWAGLVLCAAGDPLRGPGGFVTYDLDGERRFGYVLTRAASAVRGEPWGMGVLYDVDPTAPGAPPAPHRALGKGFRQRAEIEFGYT